MKKLVFIFSILFVFQANLFSQESINDYKYIVVPNQFDFLKGKDKYRLNSLTKFLFKKNNFTAFLEGETLPDDLFNNRCLALYADVNKVKGGFLKTKLQIELKDCRGKSILISKIGETKIKEYAKAYNIAIREAFVSFEYLDYKYVPNKIIQSQNSSNTEALNETTKVEVKKAKEEIERLQEEIKTLKEVKEKQVEVVETPKVKEEIKEAIKQPIVKKEVEKIVEDKTPEITKKVIETLYAQPIDKGFQVVDSTPKVVMTLLETTKVNTFIVKNKNAIVYKEDGFWYLSKNDGNIVTTEKLNIKF